MVAKHRPLGSNPMVQFMKSRLKNKNNGGFAIVEVLVSLAIIAVIIVTFESLIISSAKISRANQSEFQANLYLRETVEITKALELSGNWSLLNMSCTNSSQCHFTENGNSWISSIGNEILDGIYTRSFYIEAPSADAKKIIVTIIWNNGMRDRTLTLESYAYSGIY